MTIEQNLERVMEIGYDLKHIEPRLNIAFEDYWRRLEKGFDYLTPISDLEVDKYSGETLTLWLEFNEILEELKRDRTLQVIRACV